MLDRTVNIEGLDINDAMNRLRDNSKLYTKLVARFLDGAELKALNDALKSGIMEDSRAAAHTIKGTAANLSVVEIREIAADLEQDLKKSESISELHFQQSAEIERRYITLKSACAPYLEVQ